MRNLNYIFPTSETGHLMNEASSTPAAVRANRLPGGHVFIPFLLLTT